jgi:hypothetical protein
MARFENSIDIKQPVERVFSYVVDLNNFSHWEPTVLDWEQTSMGKMGVSSTFRGDNRVMGRRWPWTAKVTEYKPNQLVNETVSSGKTVTYTKRIFQTISGGTRFTLVYDMRIGGVTKLFAPLITGSTRRKNKKSLDNLKKILEV